MKKTHIIALIGMGLLAACSGVPEGDANFETEGWIDTAPPGPPSEKPDPYGGEDGEDEGEDEGDEDGEEEAGAVFVIYAGYENGMLLDPQGEFYASDGEQVTCEAFFPVEAGEALDGCQECDQAHTFTFGEPELDIDVDGACAGFGIPDLGGTMANLGWDGNEGLFREVDGLWEQVGEAFVEDGEIILEWPAD